MGVLDKILRAGEGKTLRKLEGIANEMESTLLRSSFSPIVKEGLDASAALFTVAGETLTKARSNSSRRSGETVSK